MKPGTSELLRIASLYRLKYLDTKLVRQWDANYRQYSLQENSCQGPKHGYTVQDIYIVRIGAGILPRAVLHHRKEARPESVKYDLMVILDHGIQETARSLEWL